MTDRLDGIKAVLGKRVTTEMVEWLINEVERLRGLAAHEDACRSRLLAAEATIATLQRKETK